MSENRKIMTDIWNGLNEIRDAEMKTGRDNHWNEKLR